MDAPAKLIRRMQLRQERWPLRQPLAVSGEIITDTELVVVRLTSGAHVGRGECSPMRRFGNSVAGTLAQLETTRAYLPSGISRQNLLPLLPRGPSRNALDCALWDLEAKLSRRSIWELVGFEPPAAVPTLRTVGLDTPERMAAQARALAWPLLKLKLGEAGDLERVAAVRAAVPDARLFVDVNEGWTMDQLRGMVEPLRELGVEAIEQPLPAAADDALRGFASPIPLIADESCQDSSSLDALQGKYRIVNIKLDKCGGLTEALRLAEQARQRGLRLMVGCMTGTSLAMAPAYVVGSRCDFVDLDAPTVQASDREPAMRYAHGCLHRFQPELWG